MKNELKMIQFGEGNFLRAFVDAFVQQANDKGVFNGSIAVIKPRAGGNLDKYRAQNNEWNVVLRGKLNGEVVNDMLHVSCVSEMLSAYDDYDSFMALAHSESLRFMVSNTTEAGIVYDERDTYEMTPPETFPGKAAKFLYERYKFFSGDMSKGLIVLPVELIDDNGYVLRDCILKHAQAWGLDEGFKDWINNACVFCSTLVDRIVSGYPEDAEELWKKLGYEDKCIVACEPYASWVIETDRDISAELALQDAGLPVIYTNDISPYRKRKVRILNGAHTSFVLASYLKGNDTVGESMNDPLVRSFVMRTLNEEVMPTIDLPREELEAYASAVIERFENPFIRHLLLSISLNSLSKWRTRCMPTLIDYVKMNNALPRCLTFSMAALLAFYSGANRSGNVMYGRRGEEEYKISDDADYLEAIETMSKRSSAEYTHAVVADSRIWGIDLFLVPEFESTVARDLAYIRSLGAEGAMKKLMENRICVNV